MESPHRLLHILNHAAVWALKRKLYPRIDETSLRLGMDAVDGTDTVSPPISEPASLEPLTFQWLMIGGTEVGTLHGNAMPSQEELSFLESLLVLVDREDASSDEVVEKVCAVLREDRTLVPLVPFLIQYAIYYLETPGVSEGMLKRQFRVMEAWLGNPHLMDKVDESLHLLLPHLVVMRVRFPDECTHLLDHICKFRPERLRVDIQGFIYPKVDHAPDKKN